MTTRGVGKSKGVSFRHDEVPHWQMKITWHDSGIEPSCPPNPDYPNGIDLNIAPAPGESESCYVPLPYPARRIGHYLVECPRCGRNAAVTTAGRRDDPRSLTMPCGQLTKQGTA